MQNTQQGGLIASALVIVGIIIIVISALSLKIVDCTHSFCNEDDDLTLYDTEPYEDGLKEGLIDFQHLYAVALIGTLIGLLATLVSRKGILLASLLALFLSINLYYFYNRAFDSSEFYSLEFGGWAGLFVGVAALVVGGAVNAFFSGAPPYSPFAQQPPPGYAPHGQQPPAGYPGYPPQQPPPTPPTGA